MAACVISATAGHAASEHRIEELEADLEELDDGQGERFLQACGVPAAEIDPTITRAREIAARDGTVVLSVEQTGADATATAAEPAAIVLSSPPATTARGYAATANASPRAARPLSVLG